MSMFNVRCSNYFSYLQPRVRRQMRLIVDITDLNCLNHHVYADDTQMIEQTTIPGIPGPIMKLRNGANRDDFN